MQSSTNTSSSEIFLGSSVTSGGTTLGLIACQIQIYMHMSYAFVHATIMKRHDSNAQSRRSRSLTTVRRTRGHSTLPPQQKQCPGFAEKFHAGDEIEHFKRFFEFFRNESISSLEILEGRNHLHGACSSFVHFFCNTVFGSACFIVHRAFLRGLGRSPLGSDNDPTTVYNNLIKNSGKNIAL